MSTGVRGARPLHRDSAVLLPHKWGRFQEYLHCEAGEGASGPRAMFGTGLLGYSDRKRQKLEDTHVRTRAAAGLMAAALAVTAFTPIASAQFAKPVVQAGYHVARLSNGRPEIQGIWTNATSTPLEREPNMATGWRYAEEAAEIEGATAARNARQNAPTSQETKHWKDRSRGRTSSTNAAPARAARRAATTPAGPIRAIWSCGCTASRAPP